MEMTDYGNGWIGYAPVGPALPRKMRPTPIASYRALLPGDGGSSITFTDGTDRADLVAALNRRPEYMPFTWPDHEVSTDADLRTLALLKILAIVSFGAGWRSSDPNGILAQPMADRPDLVSRPAPWLRATGDIDPNGDGSAGFEDLDDSEPHPPLDIIGGSDDRLLAALAGADLIRLIRAERPSWDPVSESGSNSR